MEPDGTEAVWPEWVWPHWLQRQLEPTSPDYTPARDDPSSPPAGPRRRLPDRLTVEPANTTDRSWTILGNLSSAARATVDRCGLVTTRLGRWSLDWWIGADDRWHVPSRDAAVRQHLVDGMPVVETAMRIPGGDAVHRVHAVRDGDVDLLVVDVENRSPVPFAVAFAIRPYDLLGVGEVQRIELDEARLVVTVDGSPAVHFAKPPRRVAASNGAAGDVAQVVMSGRADADVLPADLSCPDRFAQAAFVFPVPHTATVRVALPIGPAEAQPPGRRRRPATTGTAVDVRSLPDGERVASGWRTQGERGVRLELPDARLSALVDSARRQLLLVPGAGDLVSIPPRPLDHVAAVSVLGSLDAFGYHDEVDRVLDGWLDGDADLAGRHGAALVALGRHWRLAGVVGSGAHDDELALGIGRAVRALEKAYGRRRTRVGAAPRSWSDAAWSIEGGRVAADLLDALDQADAARSVRAATWPALALAAGGGPVDVADLALVNAEVRPAGWVDRVEAVRRTFDVDGAVHDANGPSGLRPAATAMLARAELAIGSGSGPQRDGERGPEDRLAWLLDHASDTAGWPEVVHPRTGRGCAGAGQDPVATAELLALVRDLLVRETGDGLALCGSWPVSWLGQGLEVHGAPTTFGVCSFAIRWHGDRPALLWDVEGPAAPLRLTVPGLDATWTTTEAKGEALLAAPAGIPAAGVGGSFA